VEEHVGALALHQRDQRVGVAVVAHDRSALFRLRRAGAPHGADVGAGLAQRVAQAPADETARAGDQRLEGESLAEDHVILICPVAA
jgi:hypothetical protein